MTEPNPFAPEPLAPTLGARQLPVLPLHLVGVALLISVVSIAVTLIGWLMNDIATDAMFWLRYVASYWLTHLLMAGLGVYWLANFYMERHSVASYRQPAAGSAVGELWGAVSVAELGAGVRLGAFVHVVV